MEQKKLRQKPFEHIGIDEYGFFVRNTKDRFEGGNMSIENTFESWKNGTANNKLCWTVSVEKLGLKSFIDNHHLVYPYCECILVPDGSKESVDDINKLLGSSANEELTEIEKMQLSNEEMKAEIKELKELLKAKVKTPTRERNQKVESKPKTESK